MAIVSQIASGQPDCSHRHDKNNQWRVLIGWNHTNDTEKGLKEGQLWAWVSRGLRRPKLQIYDRSYNRSEEAGEVRMCGVANFTMIQMFHPAWITDGTIPQDKNSEDKKACRSRYHELIRQHRMALDLPAEEGLGETEEIFLTDKVEKEIKCNAAADTKQHNQNTYRVLQDSVHGALEIVPGGSVDDPMFVADD